MTGNPTSSGDLAGNGSGTVKFLCSYGGRILPRYPDGMLRYVGGETRVLSVDRSITFAELAVKLGEMSGVPSVIVRCQLPTDDLDALVSVSSDEDVLNLIEEYDRFNQGKTAPSKVRAFLWARSTKPKAPPSPPPSLRLAGKAHRPGGIILLPTDSWRGCAYQTIFPSKACWNQQNWHRHSDPRSSDSAVPPVLRSGRCRRRYGTPLQSPRQISTRFIKATTGINPIPSAHKIWKGTSFP